MYSVWTHKVLDEILETASARTASDELVGARSAYARLRFAFSRSTRNCRSRAPFVRLSANQEARKSRGSGEHMMMNERVDVMGGDDRIALLGKLHRTLKRLSKARAFIDVKEAEALREAQRLQLWKQFGYTSLVDYMERELGYTPRAAEDRLRVAKALPELPKLTEALQTGCLNFSQAKELTRVVTPETEQVWIEKAQDMNVREVERAVAGHVKGDLPEDPIDPNLVRKTMYLSVRPETEVLFREAKQKLEKERGEKLDEDAVLEALCRSLLNEARTHVGANETQPQSTAELASHGAPYRVAVTVCKECKRGEQHGGGAVATMTPAAVERAMCDAQWIGDIDSSAVERAHQEIPPATRRKVLHRDQATCQVPGCRSHMNLDIHHIVHRENGGTNEMSNLVTLCEAHHLAHHDGTLAIERINGVLAFRYQGRNNFTRVTREVATKKALRDRGFERDQIKAIMTRVITHVGASELHERQWLEVAMRYAKELAS